MYDKSVTIDVPCPKCNHTKTLSIAEIETNPNYICEQCKSPVKIDGTELIKGLDKSMNDLDRVFDNF